MHTYGREKEVIALKDFILYTSSVLLIMVASLIYIWPNIEILDLNYQFSKLEKEQNELLKQNRLLKIETETLKSLEKIEGMAFDKGFSSPGKGQVVYVIAKN